MSRKRTRRRIRPLVDPIQRAIEGASIASDALLQHVAAGELTAIECFRTGRAGRQEWLDLADMLNICETMADCGVGPEALESCRIAQKALADAHERHHKEGRSLVLTGPQLVALRDAWEYHDLQRRSISRSEYERYIEKTRNRIRSAHPDLKVCYANPA